MATKKDQPINARDVTMLALGAAGATIWFMWDEIQKLWK